MMLSDDISSFEATIEDMIAAAEATRRAAGPQVLSNQPFRTLVTKGFTQITPETKVHLERLADDVIQPVPSTFDERIDLVTVAGMDYVVKGLPWTHNGPRWRVLCVRHAHERWKVVANASPVFEWTAEDGQWRHFAAHRAEIAAAFLSVWDRTRPAGELAATLLADNGWTVPPAHLAPTRYQALATAARTTLATLQSLGPQVNVLGWGPVSDRASVALQAFLKIHQDTALPSTLGDGAMQRLAELPGRLDDLARNVKLISELGRSVLQAAGHELAALVAELEPLPGLAQYRAAVEAGVMTTITAGTLVELLVTAAESLPVGTELHSADGTRRYTVSERSGLPCLDARPAGAGENAAPVASFRHSRDVLPWFSAASASAVCRLAEDGGALMAQISALQSPAFPAPDGQDIS